jgi:genome maintenance exonuclease 1
MKHNTKYNYHQGTRITDHGTRVYNIAGYKLPSVTTILAQTKDKTYLNDWRNKIGHEEAERIKNLSSKRGTSMHKFIEKHITGEGYDDLTEVGVQAKPMAQKIIEIGFTPIEHYFGCEVMLHYPGLYAGSTDLVCEHNGLETIADFKQSNKPKREEWIDDYKLQIAAYAMAHDYVYGSQIRQGIIMVCTPDCYYQEFKFQDGELRRWKHEFLKRLDSYYYLKQDYKEEAHIDTNELLKEFEKEANK